jgi:MarR family transcriptional regulator for hemolysin
METQKSRAAEFTDELSKVSRKMRTLFDARVKRKGLTLARARLLMRLRKGEGISQTALADDMEIESPTLVRLLDSLERQDLIERRPVEGDRRAKQVFLTKAGRAQAAEVSRLAEEFRTDILAGADADDMAAAVRVFRVMAASMTGAE